MKISLEKTNDAVSLFRNKSILFALIVSLPLMLVVFLFVRRVVTRPLLAMSESLTLLAKGEGDLTFRLDASHRDEIGTTAASFNRMLATIADLVRHVGDSAKAVTDAAHQLTHGSARPADGSHQQNAQSEAAAQQVDALA
ncbi:HAMP domain-containing protein [Paludibacterium denitrificans]|uniref:HAMP domain-containing protein n=1 Tax=Paludibacterium denitrificans TaxID=2675226 RepID=A0A844GEP6_9NEIS|nr:methyl-accepting chemotaxis protein [Paludibacterium denitrificans]MTD33790.1 HAMP domain-containing protein [Paludibacterium denitrificans]